MITVEYLEAQKRKLEKQRDEKLAELNQIEGALRMCQFLLAKAKEPDPQQEQA